MLKASIKELENIINVCDKYSRHEYFRINNWRSQNILENLKLEHLKIDDYVRSEINAPMWRNLISEYDGLHLSNEIRKNQEQYSIEFLNFEKIWLPDEINHYLGVLQIYSTIFERDLEDVHDEVSSREPDFLESERYIKNEFLLCNVFAYDELLSTRGYNDAFPVYDSFCNSSLKKWIRLAARDEMYHCMNILNVIKRAHSNYLSEVPNVLKDIVQSEYIRLNDYTGTFIFDHDAPKNDTESKMLEKCANDLCRYLSVLPAF